MGNACKDIDLTPIIFLESESLPAQAMVVVEKTWDKNIQEMKQANCGIVP